ncbi:MAG: 2Fe-2S iron-sulfur cluster-binding protein [Verrucomicrobiota bacterium]|nr:2Fe-2S iron-sulfur cluster-binding protein [Verrucomicrobiota bacterium]
MFGSPSTRRKFLKQLAGTSAALAIGSRLRLNAQNGPAAVGTVAGAAALAPTVPLALTINGRAVEMNIDTRVTLLDLLREHLDLTGSKKGCDHGQCGACTVLVNGRRVNSCLSLAIMNDGAEVTTIEGIAQGDQLHPVQAAFIEHDGFQCGYCTPGQICSAVGLINEGHANSAAEIREFMSGNLCRCGAYPNIVDAIRSVAGKDGAAGA